MARACAMYRLVDDFERLLYVGISFRPDARARQHAAEKPWWGQVAYRTVEWFPDRSSAVRAEAHAIAEEAPVYNKLRPADSRDWRLPPVGDSWLTAEPVALRCAGCGYIDGGWIVAEWSTPDTARIAYECTWCGDVDLAVDVARLRELGEQGQGWGPLVLEAA